MQLINLLLTSAITAFGVPLLLFVVSGFTLYYSITMASYARRRNKQLYEAVTLGRGLTSEKIGSGRRVSGGGASGRREKDSAQRTKSHKRTCPSDRPSSVAPKQLTTLKSPIKVSVRQSSPLAPAATSPNPKFSLVPRQSPSASPTPRSSKFSSAQN